MAGRRSIAVAAAAVVLGGGAGAAWLSSADGARPGPPATTAASTSALPPASVPAGQLLASLPLARARGRILLTTRACRLGLVDLATRRMTDPRPNVSTCTARFGGRSGTVALVEPKERTNTTTLTRLAGTADGDRTIPLPGLLEDLAISPDGDLAACAGGGLGDAARTTIVVSLGSNGSAHQVPGCNPAWWGGRLAWIDRRDRLVAGDRIISLGRRTAPETIGSSTDGRILAVLAVGGSGAADVSILRAGSDVPVRRLVLDGPPALSSPTIRIAGDGSVLALRGDGGQWSLYRTDGSVPPARDVLGQPLLDVAFAPDGSGPVAALAGGRLVFLDAQTLGPIAQLPLNARTIDWAP